MRSMNPPVLYQGAPCRFGHSGLRYRSTKHCIECQRGYARAQYQARAERKQRAVAEAAA